METTLETSDFLTGDILKHLPFGEENAMSSSDFYEKFPITDDPAQITKLLSQLFFRGEIQRVNLSAGRYAYYQVERQQPIEEQPVAVNETAPSTVDVKEPAQVNDKPAESNDKKLSLACNIVNYVVSHKKATRAKIHIIYGHDAKTRDSIYSNIWTFIKKGVLIDDGEYLRAGPNANKYLARKKRNNPKINGMAEFKPEIQLQEAFPPSVLFAVTSDDCVILLLDSGQIELPPETVRKLARMLYNQGLHE